MTTLDILRDLLDIELVLDIDDECKRKIKTNKYFLCKKNLYFNSKEIAKKKRLTLNLRDLKNDGEFVHEFLTLLFTNTGKQSYEDFFLNITPNFSSRVTIMAKLIGFFNNYDALCYLYDYYLNEHKLPHFSFVFMAIKIMLLQGKNFLKRYQKILFKEQEEERDKNTIVFPISLWKVIVPLMDLITLSNIKKFYTDLEKAAVDDSSTAFYYSVFVQDLEDGWMELLQLKKTYNLKIHYFILKNIMICHSEIDQQNEYIPIYISSFDIKNVLSLITFDPKLQSMFNMNAVRNYVRRELKFCFNIDDEQLHNFLCCDFSVAAASETAKDKNNDDDEN